MWIPFPFNDAVPRELRDYVFDFVWDMDKLHALDLPERAVSVTELNAHLSLPYWRLDGRPFQLAPRDVMNSPERYAEQHRRTLQADLTYPIIVCRRSSKPLMILDGVHRLLKAMVLGHTTIQASVFSLDLVPRILPTISHH